MKEYFIVGSGLQGCLTAFHLINSNVPPQNITILEKGKKFFPGWDYEYINTFRVFLGFQGFELPRAQPTLDMILHLIGSLSGTLKPNKRYICTNQSVALFSDGFQSFPKIVRESLSAVPFSNGYTPPNIIDFFDSLSSTPFMQLIRECSARYSDNWLESTRFFYPWFFPSEFKVPITDDEGLKFQAQVRENLVKSNYFFPSNGFDNLSTSIVNALLNLGVNFKSSCDGLSIYRSRSDYQQFIWTASSFPLLADLGIEYSLKRNTIQSVIFSSEKLASSPYYDATEILTMESSLPMLSRVSFPPNYASDGCYKTFLVQAEFFPKASNTSQDMVNTFATTLQGILQVDDLTFEGFSEPKNIYSVTSETNNLEQSLSTAALSLANFQIPLIYWGPINMAKVALAVENVII